MYSYFGPPLASVFPDPKKPKIDNVLRFDGTNDYLNRVVTASNRTTWTWSAWVKKDDLSRRDYPFSGGAAGDTSNLFYLQWEDNTSGRYNQLAVVWRESDPNNTRSISTTASYNDTSVWHHIVLSVDTTQSAASDKMKLYVDGKEITSFSTDQRNTIGTNDPLSVNAAGNICMGAYAYDLSDTGSRFKGQMAEVHFIDGQALDYTPFVYSFANGVYIPKKGVADLDYGNNGFYMDFSQPSSTINAFDSITWTGTDDATFSIDYLPFTPDLVWAKSRTQAKQHQILDSVRGNQAVLFPSATDAETNVQTSSTNGGLKSIDTNGFTIQKGTGTPGNDSLSGAGENIVAWAWKAGGAPTVDNSGGQTPTSASVMIDGVASTAQLPTAGIYPTKMSVNTEAGFSIVQYTGTGSVATIPHGLNSAPDVIIIKDTTNGTRTIDQWPVLHSATGAAGDLVYLYNNAEGIPASVVWNNTNPTANVFTIGSWGGINYTGDNFIAYCWHSVEGYSKFGSYTGNGSSNGPVVTTGFRPAFLMIKNTTTGTTDNWHIIDNARDFANPNTYRLKADVPDIESSTDTSVDLLSDGFQLINTSGARNASNHTYIYMAFADTSPDFGVDRTTNSNDFSVEGNITPDDQLLDTPNLRFATLDPDDIRDMSTLPYSPFTSLGTGSLSEGNLQFNDGSDVQYQGTAFSTLGKSSGKWYVEFRGVGRPGFGLYDGVRNSNDLNHQNYPDQVNQRTAINGPGRIWTPHSSSTFRWDYPSTISNETSHNTKVNNGGYGTSWVSGDIVGMAFDLDNGTIEYFINGFSQGQAFTDLNSIYSSGNDWYVAVSDVSGSVDTYTYVNFGQDHTFAGQKPALLTPYSDTNGVGEFYYEPPSGFLALSTDPLENFRTKQS